MIYCFLNINHKLLQDFFFDLSPFISSLNVIHNLHIELSAYAYECSLFATNFKVNFNFCYLKNIHHLQMHVTF